MNNSELETILRNAPCPAAPATLKQKLLAEASSGQRQHSSKTVLRHSPSGWLRRWWPALAPAAASVACAVVLTAQHMEINDLKQSLEKLTPAALVQPNTAVTAKSSQGDSASQLQSQEEELTRLKQLAAQLSSEIAMLEQLRQQIAAESANKLSPEEIDAMNQARERAMRIQCVNNLKQIGLAARMWAQDHNDVYPTNFVCMSNELNTPKILVCPADTNRVSAASFSSFTDANCSYDLFFATESEPEQVLSRCHVHNNVGLSDGSVQMINPDRLEERDGKLYLRRNP